MPHKPDSGPRRVLHWAGNDCRPAERLVALIKVAARVVQPLSDDDDLSALPAWLFEALRQTPSLAGRCDQSDESFRRMLYWARDGRVGQPPAYIPIAPIFAAIVSTFAGVGPACSFYRFVMAAFVAEAVADAEARDFAVSEVLAARAEFAPDILHGWEIVSRAEA